MLIDLLNIKNNAYDRSLKKYLKPQNPNTLEKVDGKWKQFTPNRPYYAESPEVITAYNLAKLGRANEIKNPKLYKEALQLVAQGGPVLHDPSPSFDNVDKRFRGPVHPTSSAIGKMMYNPKTERVTFAFRTKKGVGKTYSALMDGVQLFRWLSSASVGRYFNKRLKGRMIPY